MTGMLLFGIAFQERDEKKIP